MSRIKQLNYTLMGPSAQDNLAVELELLRQLGYRVDLQVDGTALIWRPAETIFGPLTNANIHRLRAKRLAQSLSDPTPSRVSVSA
jgi:hypothetical protein